MEVTEEEEWYGLAENLNRNGDFVTMLTLTTLKGRIPLKIPAIQWEKIFAKHMSEKGLTSKIYKELSKLTHKKKNLLKNGQKI